MFRLTCHVALAKGDAMQKIHLLAAAAVAASFALAGCNNSEPVVINKEDQSKFPSEPSSMFMGNKICVTGIISDYKGKKQILVTDPKQITVK